MNDLLYFMPMIAKALQQAAPAAALRTVMEEIIRLGRQPQYARGYRQFLRFMDEIRSHRASQRPGDNSVIPDVLAELFVERVANTPKSALDALPVREESGLSQWQEEYQQLAAALRDAMQRPPVSEILIKKEDVLVATCSLERGGSTGAVSGITPGDYCLVLETGRVLWEGHLDEQDLLWSKAFPAQPLKMAADTGESVHQPTQQINLLEGALIMRCYAGLEAGWLEMELRNTEAEG